MCVRACVRASHLLQHPDRLDAHGGAARLGLEEALDLRDGGEHLDADAAVRRRRLHEPEVLAAGLRGAALEVRLEVGPARPVLRVAAELRLDQVRRRDVLEGVLLHGRVVGAHRLEDRVLLAQRLNGAQVVVDLAPARVRVLAREERRRGLGLIPSRLPHEVGRPRLAQLRVVVHALEAAREQRARDGLRVVAAAVHVEGLRGGRHPRRGTPAAQAARREAERGRADAPRNEEPKRCRVVSMSDSMIVGRDEKFVVTNAFFARED